MTIWEDLVLIVHVLAEEPEELTFCPFPWKRIFKAFFLALIPFTVYLIWALTDLGTGFRFVERFFFGRGSLRVVPFKKFNCTIMSEMVYLFYFS